jgi:hypothetical protein
MSEEQLQQLLEAGDAQNTLAFFRGMPEEQRRALAPQCLQWFNQIKGATVIQISPNTWQWNPIMPAAQVGVFATATLSEIKRLPSHVRPPMDLVCELLLDRRPAWSGAWLLTLLDDSHYWSHWPLLRKCIQNGLTEKPEDERYYLGMISGLVRRFDKQTSLQQLLLDDPALLEDEVWRLFEYEGGGENSLANFDRFGRGHKWADTLLALMRDGHLPRERLLQCTVEALERDFNHYRAKWFASFYDALEPTDEEQRQHAESLLHLLGCSAPNIVTWAFGRVQTFFKSGVYDPEALLSGIEPVLRARSQATVKKALKLIENVVKRAPQCRDLAASVASVALGHEDHAVQEAAFDFVEQYGSRDDSQLQDTIAAQAQLVSPSLRKRLAAWLPTAGSKPAIAEASAAPVGIANGTQLEPRLRQLFSIDALAANLELGRLEIPAASFDGTDIPRLDPQERLAPIEDIDELIDVCARVVEDGSLVDDAERAIDGLSRLCDVVPEDFDRRLGPILKRVTGLLKKGAVPFLGMGPEYDLCGLIYAWGRGIAIRARVENERLGPRFYFEIEGEKLDWWGRNLNKPIGMLSRRSMALAERLAVRQAAGLLSAPTHAGGWIDPAVLVDRANQWKGEPPGIPDICLALLRLAPDNRQAALKSLKKSTDEWKQAIRHALGGKSSVGKSAAIWAAAARARSPWADDPDVDAAFPDFGPDAGRVAEYQVGFKSVNEHLRLQISVTPALSQEVDQDCLTIAFHRLRDGDRNLQWELGGIAGRTVPAVRWTASIWPLGRESYFAGAADELGDNLDWWEAMWQNRVLLEPLLDSGTPLRQMGLLLLALGLAAKEPGEYGLATDTAIGAIEDGRLGSDNLGRILGALLPTGFIKPGRWEKTLADVGRASPVHGLIVQQALQSALAGDPQQMPRDFGKLLELLHELSIEIGQSITCEACRAFLSRMAGSGKAAKTAKALLALEPGSFETTGRPILEQALNQRIEAALARQSL